MTTDMRTMKIFKLASKLDPFSLQALAACFNRIAIKELGYPEAKNISDIEVKEFRDTELWIKSIEKLKRVEAEVCSGDCSNCQKFECSNNKTEDDGYAE